MKIPEQELNNYMVKKISEDNKLRILFGMEPNSVKRRKIEEKEKQKKKIPEEYIIEILKKGKKSKNKIRNKTYNKFIR